MQTAFNIHLPSAPIGARVCVASSDAMNLHRLAARAAACAASSPAAGPLAAKARARFAHSASSSGVLSGASASSQHRVPPSVRSIFARGSLLSSSSTLFGERDELRRLATAAAESPMARILRRRDRQRQAPSEVSACAGEAHGDRKHGRRVTTTPLYYVNAAPHMGSAYPTMAVDALSRYHRLRGQEGYMVTGTDEHGEKIATTADGRGKEPKDHCDEISAEFKRLWSKLDIKYDSFIRTTDGQHEAIVAEFLERCWENGDIYKKDYEGLYCVGCEEFKDPKELIDGKVCALHQKPVVERKEENYFFALSKYQQALEKLFEERPDFVQPESRFNEVKGWVKEGLRDFSISRANVKWGIPVPRDPSQTIYVWFDALLGYISALLGPEDEAKLDVAIAKGWPADVHVIGKDILRFHAVYWPAMLMSAGVALPRRVFGHGFLTKDGLKMGKSLGNVLEPEELADKYGSDALRYYFLKVIEFGADGDFAMERFVNHLNADLANDLGNLLNRCLNLLKKNAGGLVPLDSEAAIPAGGELRTLIEEQVRECAAAYERLDFTGACEAALAISRYCNKWVDVEAPWTLYKNGEKEKADAVIVAVLESVRVVAILLSPVVPLLASRVCAQLGYTPEQFASLRWDEAKWGFLKTGMQMPQPAPVFQRIEMPVAEGEEAAPAPAAAAGGKKKAAKQ